MTRISPIVDAVYAVEANAGIEVRAVLVVGTRFTALLDSLAKPSDLDEVRTFVTEHGRPLLIVNSHADWDHWWGNAAFPDVPVIAHHLSYDRQLEEGEKSLAEMQAKDDRYSGIALRPATIAFNEGLSIDLGGIHVELNSVPGHTHDCIVAWLPERELLFAGDVAEDPIPLVTEGPIAGWPALLRSWAERARIVVPAHGAIAGPELLTRNAAYLEGLFAEPRRVVPELEGADIFYQEAHQRNLGKATRESLKG